MPRFWHVNDVFGMLPYGMPGSTFDCCLKKMINANKKKNNFINNVECTKNKKNVQIAQHCVYAKEPFRVLESIQSETSTNVKWRM